jgi:hypothetical protein
MVLKRLMMALIAFISAACAVAQNPSTPTVPTAFSATSTPAETVTGHPCWMVQPLHERKEKLLGSLFYIDHEVKKEQLLDLSSNKTAPTKMKPWSTISPDGSMAAAVNSEKQLQIYFQNQSKSYEVPDQVDFGGFLSGNQVWLRVLEEDSFGYVADAGRTDKYYVLSLDTGELSFHQIFLPHYWMDLSGYSIGHSYVAYSPNRLYAIYSADKQPEGRNVLFDFTKQKVVWRGARLRDAVVGLAYPVWNQDSTAVMTVEFPDALYFEQNFFRVALDGSHTQATHLEKLINDPYSLHKPSWSPNGRYLAYWVKRKNNLSLFISDLINNTDFDTCISEDISLSMTYEIPFYWSPDGNKLVLSGEIKFADSNDSIQDIASGLLVIDLENHEINKLPVNGSPLGWLSWELP